MMTTLTIGGATLMLGDAIERMREIPDSSVDLVLTDPPFSSGAAREAGKTGYNKTMTRSTKARDRWFGSDSLTTRGFIFLLRSCAVEWQRVLRPGGHALAFIDWRMDDHLAEAVEPEAEYQRRKALAADAIESADLRRAGMLIWNKTHFGMGRHFRNQYELILHFTKGVGRAPLRRDVANVLDCPPVRGGHHPTEKPEALLRELVSVVCAPGETVLDPFFGSCATGRAAQALGCQFIGIERDPRFFDVGRTLIAGAERAAA